MEPEYLPPTQESDSLQEPEHRPIEMDPAQPPAFVPPAETHYLQWIFIGEDGMRAGWSVLVFLFLAILMMATAGRAATYLSRNVLHLAPGIHTPLSGIISESVELLGILFAGSLVALMERRRIRDFNLVGPRMATRFTGGLIAGFAALSVLVGALASGGWLRFGPVALTSAQILSYAAVWALVFLMVGLFEEGTFRCYLQFTLTRGLNFWWALGINATLCASLLRWTKGNGAWGVYSFALLGLLPCLLLFWKGLQRTSFWYAAWVTSTLFGAVHTGNDGENWIGIFAAALIGFVFCVSIRLTGSAWWAIGCHASWDWAETFFYGTADSGFVAPGHLLSTSVAGNPLWSGGTDGPEGSLLVLPVILLLLILLLVVYGRRSVRSLQQAA